MYLIALYISTMSDFLYILAYNKHNNSLDRIAKFDASKFPKLVFLLDSAFKALIS